MLSGSCSSSHKEHNKIGFAIFGFLWELIWILQVASKNTQWVRNFLRAGPWKD
jgi:hypothetical protein